MGQAEKWLPQILPFVYARTDISYEHAPVELAQAESLEELVKWWVGS